MKAHKRAIIKFVLVVLICWIVYIVLDIVNILRITGIDCSNINTDLLSIITNIALTVSIFGATYILINSREIQKGQNAQEAVNVMLDITYCECEKTIKMLLDDKWLQTIVSKVDFNSNDGGEALSSLKQGPFSYDSLIMGYLDKGLLTGELLQDYLTVKNEYLAFVTMTVALFDHKEVFAPKASDLLDELRVARSKLHPYISQTDSSIN